jgi:hypothetical protein
MNFFSENLVAPGIELGPLDLYPRTLTTTTEAIYIIYCVLFFIFPKEVMSMSICFSTMNLENRVYMCKLEKNACLLLFKSKIT